MLLGGSVTKGVSVHMASPTRPVGMSKKKLDVPEEALKLGTHTFSRDIILAVFNGMGVVGSFSNRT